jgi:caa(3)-type oxidase subunit IV
MNRTVRSCLLTSIALLGLLALTVDSSFIAAGRWTLVANFGIDAAKPLLVVLVFMELGKVSATIWLAPVGDLAWLALLALHGGANFAMR